jgi:hypothetical protein
MAGQGAEKLFRIYLVYSSALALGGSLIFLYFRGQGISDLGMLAIMTGNYLGPLLALPLLKKLKAGGALALGIAGQAASYLALGVVGGTAGASLFIVLAIPVFLFFWVPFNSIWFRKKEVGGAFHGAFYYAIPIVIGIAGPSAAGLVVDAAGYGGLFGLCSALLLLGAASIRKEYDEGLEFSVSRALSELRGLRSLLFLEGFAFFGFGTVAAIITLEYFSEPLGLGAFMSATALLAVAISFAFAKMSDTAGKRGRFLLLSSAGLGASLIFAAFSTDVAYWFCAMVAINFFKTIFLPFPIALLLDRKPELHNAMYGRELLLNAGRVCAGAACMGILLLSGDLRAAIGAMGVGMLAYAAAFALWKKKKLGAS